MNRQLKSGIGDRALAELVVGLRMDDRFCIVSEDGDKREPMIICSLGLFQEKAVSPPLLSLSSQSARE